KRAARIPLEMALPDVAAMTVSDATASEKYSAGPNHREAAARRGAAKKSTSMLPRPPMKDATTAVPSATPPSPFLAIAYPSYTVAMALGLPGIPKRMAGIDAPETAPK